MRRKSHININIISLPSHSLTTELRSNLWTRIIMNALNTNHLNWETWARENDMKIRLFYISSAWIRNFPLPVCWSNLTPCVITIIAISSSPISRLHYKLDDVILDFNRVLQSPQMENGQSCVVLLIIEMMMNKKRNNYVFDNNNNIITIRKTAFKQNHSRRFQYTHWFQMNSTYFE